MGDNWSCGHKPFLYTNMDCTWNMAPTKGGELLHPVVIQLVEATFGNNRIVTNRILHVHCEFLAFVVALLLLNLLEFQTCHIVLQKSIS